MHATSMGAISLWLCAAVAGAQAPADPPLLRPLRYDLAVTVDLERQRLDGSARIRLRNEHSRPVGEASLLLYRLLAVGGVRDAAGAPMSFRQDVVAFEDFGKLQVNHLRIPLVPALAPGAETTVEVRYGGYLLGYAETGMAYVKDRVDSAYTLLREDAHAYPTVGTPSLGVRRRAGLPTFVYAARITVPRGFTVANGGALVKRTEDDATTTFEYRSVKPSWRMDFAVARFGVARRGPLTVFHLAADFAGAQRILGAMSRTLALYTRWFGPLGDDPPFAVIEIPDGWGSQADVTCLLQAAAAFRDPAREYELYHEISHLWNPPDADRPSPRWNEGLASFLEDITLDSLTGRATTDSNAVRLTRWLAQRVRTDPALRSVRPADYGTRSMTDYSYSVGSLMFYALYRVVGHEVFARIIGEYHRAYAAGGGGTAQLVRTARTVSPVDLTALFDDWLYSTRWTAIVEGATSARSLYERYESRAAR